MGRDKADVMVAGRAMLERVVSAIEPTVDQVVLLGADREGFVSWPDSVHAQGPLAGVATALSRMDAEHVLVVAVDHAFVSGGTLRRLALLGDGLPIVPVDESGVRQVTCALYPKTIAGVAADEAASGGTIQTLLDRVSFQPVAPHEWESWGEDGRSWFSVDSEESLSAGLERFG